MCERYGWTFDYVLWGVSWANVRLMLTDAINIDYKSDDKSADVDEVFDISTAAGCAKFKQFVKQ